MTNSRLKGSKSCINVLSECILKTNLVPTHPFSHKLAKQNGLKNIFLSRHS
jgi:hypothetical protein